MGGRILEELKQGRALTSLEEEAHLNVLRTARHLRQGFEELLRAHDLTGAQYNALRILRGAGARGLACGGIAERMIVREPDITRLLDRLERRSLITRKRDTEDRRVVLTRITPAGLRLLARLDEPVSTLHVEQLRHLGRKRLRDFIDLLEEARAPPGTS